MASVMPSGAPQTFTGSNGAALPDFTTALNEGSGGSATIQSNQARIRTGTASGNRTSVRVTGVSRADVEIVLTWTIPALNSQFPKVYVRANTGIDTGTGYYLELEESTMVLGRSISYSSTGMATYSHGFTAGQVVRTRMACFGNRIKARTWLAANSEPTNSWQIDHTPATGDRVDAAGNIGVTTAAGTAGSKDFFFDNFDALDTETPTQATFSGTGSLAPSGVLRKTVIKAPFTGSLTPAGATAVQRVVVRVFTGALTPVGALQKALPRLFTGSLTPSGVLRRNVTKAPFTGSLTPAGATRKQANRTFAGAITPAGVGIVTFIGRIIGYPGLAVMNVIKAGDARIRHRKG